ncbi:MAG: hypothetical protein ACKO2C_00150 [Actinomycetes bacterium]
MGRRRWAAGAAAVWLVGSALLAVVPESAHATEEGQTSASMFPIFDDPTIPIHRETTGDDHVVTASGDPGQDATLRFENKGQVAAYPSTGIRVTLPAGMQVAHADGHPGVPASPITNRPVDGDVVGTSELSARLQAPYGDCSFEITRHYRFVWHEANWQAEDIANKVAEIGVEFERMDGTWVDLSPLGVRFDVLQSMDELGQPQYALEMPTTFTGNGFFCDASDPAFTFREIGEFSAPEGKALLRNSVSTEPQTVCVEATTVGGSLDQWCRAVGSGTPAPVDPTNGSDGDGSTPPAADDACKAPAGDPPAEPSDPSLESDDSGRPQQGVGDELQVAPNLRVGVPEVHTVPHRPLPHPSGAPDLRDVVSLPDRSGFTIPGREIAAPETDGARGFPPDGEIDGPRNVGDGLGCFPAVPWPAAGDGGELNYWLCLG